MDQGLFRKHILQIQKVQDVKSELCVYIQEKTGVEITQQELLLTGKKITIHTSSVKRSILLRKNIKEILKEKGYIF